MATTMEEDVLMVDSPALPSIEPGADVNPYELQGWHEAMNDEEFWNKATGVFLPGSVCTDLYNWRDAIFRMEKYTHFFSVRLSNMFVDVGAVRSWLEMMWDLARYDTAMHSVNAILPTHFHYVRGKNYKDTTGGVTVADVKFWPKEDTIRNKDNLALYRCDCQSCQEQVFPVYKRAPDVFVDMFTDKTGKRIAKKVGKESFCSKRRINPNTHNVFGNTKVIVLAKFELTNQIGSIYLTCADDRQLWFPPKHGEAGEIEDDEEM